MHLEKKVGIENCQSEENENVDEEEYITDHQEKPVDYNDRDKTPVSDEDYQVRLFGYSFYGYPIIEYNLLQSLLFLMFPFSVLFRKH